MKKRRPCKTKKAAKISAALLIVPKLPVIGQPHPYPEHQEDNANALLRSAFRRIAMQMADIPSA